MPPPINLADRTAPIRTTWRDVGMAYRGLAEVLPDGHKLDVVMYAEKLAEADALADGVLIRERSTPPAPTHVVWRAEDGWRWHTQAANNRVTYGATEGVENRLYAVRQAAGVAAAVGADLVVHDDDLHSRADTLDPRQVLAILDATAAQS